jgi:hypothetical protein
MNKTNQFRPLSDKEEKIVSFIQEKYRDPEEPSSFSGKRQLYQNLAAKYPNQGITQKLVNISLERLPVYIEAISAPSKFERRGLDWNKIGGISTDFQIDLVIMYPFQGYKNLFLMVDVAQNYLYSKPQKTKEAKESLSSFQSICEEHKLLRTMGSMTSDGGNEFNLIAKYLKSLDILFWPRTEHPKAFVVERMIRTFKYHLYRALRSHLSQNWVKYADICIFNLNQGYFSAF